MNDDMIWVKESPKSLKEGAVFALSITIHGGTTITAATSAIYKGGSTASGILSGSDTYSGNTAASKTLTFAAGTAGTYVYVNTIAIDGITWAFACQFNVSRVGDTQ